MQDEMIVALYWKRDEKASAKRSGNTGGIFQRLPTISSPTGRTARKPSTTPT